MKNYRLGTVLYLTSAITAGGMAIMFDDECEHRVRKNALKDLKDQLRFLKEFTCSTN